MKQIITMYATERCPFCVKARSLLGSLGLEYKEIIIKRGTESEREMMQLSEGRKSVPQIRIGDKPIGGFTELKKLADDNALEGLLVVPVLPVPDVRRLAWLERRLTRIDFDGLLQHNTATAQPFWFSAYVVAPIQAYLGGIERILEVGILLSGLSWIWGAAGALCMAAGLPWVGAALMILAFISNSYSGNVGNVVEYLYCSNGDNFPKSLTNKGERTVCPDKLVESRWQGIRKTMQQINRYIR